MVFKKKDVNGFDKAKDAYKKSYTFIVAPNTSGRTKRFTISDFWVKNFIFLIGIFLVAVVLLVVSYAGLLAAYNKSKQDLVSLQSINKQQQVQLYDMSELSKKVEEKLIYLDLLETKIMTIINNNTSDVQNDLYLQEVNAKLEEMNIQTSSVGGDGDAYMNYYVASNNMQDFDISGDLASIKQTLTKIDTSIEAQQDKYNEISNTVQAYDDAMNCTPKLLPIEKGTYNVSDYFGYRVYPRVEFHSGMDLAAPYGTHIYASARGTVTTAGWYSEYGNCVIINHGNGYQTLYGHMSQVACNVGDLVNGGDLIGYVGSTGYSTGNHLHYSVILNGTYIDPEPFLPSDYLPTE